MKDRKILQPFMKSRTKWKFNCFPTAVDLPENFVADSKPWENLVCQFPIKISTISRKCTESEILDIFNTNQLEIFKIPWNNFM